MSAIVEEGGDMGPFEPIKVLITMHEGMNALDLMGPLEVFSQAQHDKKNKGTTSLENDVLHTHHSTRLTI